MAKIVCKKRTHQQAFNHVWNFLNLQGKQSLTLAHESSQLICSYLGNPENGNTATRCAAGCLLPARLTADQRKALLAKEGDTATAVSRRRVVNWGIEPWFARRLQECHDLSGYPDTAKKWRSLWRQSMRDLAEAFHLTVPPIPAGAKVP